MKFHTRPLDRFPRDFTPAHARKKHPFKRNWDAILRNLRHELQQLDAGAVILQLAVRESDISVTTGWPKGDSRPAHPGVVVAADTRHGALKWACDDCADWKDNLHAIGLTLERLRLADRYGVTRGGEQYAGWKMLPGPITAGPGAPPAMTIEEAARFIADFTGTPAAKILSDKEAFAKAYRYMARMTHPDAPGRDATKWAKLEDASRLLNSLHERK